LNHFSIPYWTSGKNVAENSINIKCPFCDDHSNHLCIFKDGGNIYCWRCSKKGSLYSAIKEITRISYSKYDDILHEMKMRDLDISASAKKEKVKIKEIEFPALFKPITKKAPKGVIQYVESRNISIDTCKRYNLHYCLYGEFAQRIIIPIYYSDMLVAWQGRDFSGQSAIRYKTSDKHETNPVNSFLYNLDSISDKAILVEGVFDAIAVGNSAIASFGSSLCLEQRHKLINKDLKELIVCWDEDKYVEAEKMAAELMPFIEKIKVVRLPKDKDPADLGISMLMRYIDMADYI
jgi:DNA primase